ncbi:SIS domain-containing protein [Geothrix fermentans]|uniref:SIS domain-containing protein n=1 Tax=Geothrix fermentans TaxID=44676 RepID=UPI0004209585|nr:SIS domain-containing protein [Geothrix fermentans]
MCGIVSLCYATEVAAMGHEAGELLKRLEYRGYDSTGASFIGNDGAITLLKKVGAPSRVVPELGIDRQPGQRFIGQVRWATYGAVTDVNSQPHHVRCKVEMVGAHNGNISNTDALKPALTAQGHSVKSDNDGEMITHLTEDAYAANLADPGPTLAACHTAHTAAGLAGAIPEGAFLLIDAARKADAKAEGSYAAAFADPKVPGVVAVKSGSSLYAGIGSDAHGDFVVVSSDLTSVLSKTRMLIPLSEGEGIWFTEREYLVFTLGESLAFSVPRPKRSKLNVRDTGLRAPYRYFMEQEIASAPDNLDEVLRYYFRDAGTEGLFAAFEDRQDLCKALVAKVLALYEVPGEAALRKAFGGLLADPVHRELAARVEPHADVLRAHGQPVSDERQLLADLGRLEPSASQALALFDLLFVWKKRRRVTRHLQDLVQAIRESQKEGGRVFLVASGTSYHAALVAATFFNGLAGVGVFPCNPGQFRSMYLNALQPHDLLLGITQSGETKDLVDIFQDVRARVPALRRIALVNNENSRIPQELSEFYLPILCGPEIAVAATKSFLNQVAILYVLAASFSLTERKIAANLERAKELIAETLRRCETDVEEAAKRLYLEPSLHILGTGLIGLAREGALKIREVVLNHAEGYDAAEFKHGPNTILGKNTLFSIQDLAGLLEVYEQHRDGRPFAGGIEALQAWPELVETRFSNYPLLFVCPAEERDVRITISQIHTHKIRGADILLIAEKNPELALAVAGKPMGQDRYWSKYLEVPPCGDANLFVFAASVVLQRLAFRMSVLKMEYLDRLAVADHGVHPDAPKNVSKSITVD